nr:SusC/RagA family TonB-linked outer membrane protein [Prevotella sp.]
MINFRILAMMGLMVAAAQVKAQATDAAEGERKAPVAKQQPSYPMIEVSGTVLDAATGKPLSGVQVQALGNERYAAMTNEQGTFTIKVPNFTTSLFMHTSQYASVQVAIGNDHKVKVKMLSDKFNEMYKGDTPMGNAANLKANVTTQMSVEDLIADQLGADVRTVKRSGTPGIGSAMFIRGLNSLNANAQPLIVIDGVPQSMQYNATTLQTGGYNNILLNLNPADIENVTVLKNGTALYGAKGANGVIVISTRRGHSLATRIEANVGVGVNLVPRMPKVMDANQYMSYATEMLGTYPEIGNIMTNKTFNFLTNDPNNYYYHTYHNNTDWSKEVYESALSQNYSINVQGGDNVGMYNLSLGYTDGQSTVKKNGFSRLNVRFNSDFKITKGFTTQFDIDYVKISRDIFDDGTPNDFSQGTVTAPTLLALIKSPFLSPYVYSNTLGRFSSTLSEADDFLSPLGQNFSLANPTALLKNGEGNNKNRMENSMFHVRLAPKFKLMDGFYLSENINYTLNRNSQRYYRPKGGVPTYYVAGLGQVQTMSASIFAKEETLMSDTRLDFSRIFGAHQLKVMGGFCYLSYNYEMNNPSGQYQTAGNDKIPNVSNSMDFKDATGDDYKNASLTWYAQADYNYRNRYFLQVAASLESSSAFGDKATSLRMGGVSWGFFPSVQAGWVMTNESWFPKNAGINYLRLDAGYEISGNDDINGNAARTSFEVLKFLHNSIPAVLLDNIGNENVTFEKTHRFNVGFDSKWLDNRLCLSANYFFNHTTDLLTIKNFTTPVAGVKSYWSNAGSLDNKGFEVQVSGKPVVNRNFTLELGASVGHYKNTIKSLPNETYLAVDGNEKGGLGYTSSIYGTDNVATIVGQSAGVFYGYKTLGVFASDAEAKAAGKDGYLYQVDKTGARQEFKAGDVHFADLNGDGIISDADKTIIGNPNPDVYGNMFARATWGNFTLSAVFSYSLGNDIFNYQRSVLEGGKNFYNQTTAMVNRWRNEGQVTNVPRISYNDEIGNSRFSDRWIEDGSYLRLRSLNLNYKVPVNFSWLQGLQVWVEANNLFTITKYLGGDPEMSAANTVLYQGIDTGCVAPGRAFTVGLKINL